MSINLLNSLGLDSEEWLTYYQRLKAASSLSAIVWAAFEIGLWIARCLVEQELEHRAQAPRKWPACPHCGRALHSKGFQPRQMMTWLGVIHWQRRVGRCPNKCRDSQRIPLDEALGISAYQQTTEEVKRLGCLLSIFVPFELAAEIAEMTLVMAADGVMVPLRPQLGTPQGKTVWQEVKVAVLARLGHHFTGTGQMVSRLYQRRLVAVLGSVDTLAPRLQLEALRQGLASAPKVVWLSDGGKGFWRLYHQYFAPYAVAILDFYHAAGHLWRAAAAWLDGRTSVAQWCFERWRHLLRHGGDGQLLTELTHLINRDDLPESALKTLIQVQGYLQRHRSHISYQHFEQQEFPLGSGLVESACKWLIQQRFKGVGMRWSEDGFNHLLHLRLAWVNQRFDDLFPDDVIMPKLLSPNP